MTMKRMTSEIRRDRAGLTFLMASLSLAGCWSGCRRAPAEPDAPTAPVQTAAPVAPAAAPVAPAAVSVAAPSAVPAVPAAPGVAPAEPAVSAAPAASAPDRTIAPSVADLRRAFTTYDQQFRREDPVCARLMAEIAGMQQTIASNETAILQRLQSDPEWSRLRGELVDFQRAEDDRRRQAMLLRRGAGVTNNAQPVLLAPRQPPRRQEPGEGKRQI